MGNSSGSTKKMGDSSDFPFTLSKEIEKILKIENRSILSDGKLSRNYHRYFHEPLSSPSEFSPRKNVISYDSWNIQKTKIVQRSYIPMRIDHVGKLPVLLFFHGGAFVRHIATLLKYDNFCRKLALEVPCIVISFNYPHAPEHKCPAQYKAAINSIYNFDNTWFAYRHPKLKKEKTDASNVFLIGDEAGGNIAHHLAANIASKEIMLNNFKIKGLVTIQPLFGGEERTQSEIKLSKSPMLTLEQRDGLWKSFLRDGCNRDCKEVNVSGPNNVPKDGLKRFPKSLVIVGGLDPLQDWQNKYYNWLRNYGVDVTLVQYPQAIPGFYLYEKFMESTMMMKEIKLFVEKVRSSPCH